MSNRNRLDRPNGELTNTALRLLADKLFRDDEAALVYKEGFSAGSAWPGESPALRRAMQSL